MIQNQRERTARCTKLAEVSALPNRLPQLAVPKVAPASSPERDCYWGEQIDVSSVIGREPELQQLEQWLGVNNGEGEQSQMPCRLISIVGMGGMGKTSIAAKLTQKLAASDGIS